MEDSYDEKIAYLNKYIGLDGTYIAGEDMLTVVSLVNLLTVAARKKAPEARPIDILNKYNTTVGNKVGKEYINERISLICELFLTPDSKFRSFGLKNLEEIVAEINRIIDTWIPF